MAGCRGTLSEIILDSIKLLGQVMRARLCHHLAVHWNLPSTNFRYTLGSPWRGDHESSREKNLISLLAKRLTPNPNNITTYQESILNRTVYVCSPSDIYSAFNIVARHAMPHTRRAQTHKWRHARAQYQRAAVSQFMRAFRARVLCVYGSRCWLCLVCVCHTSCSKRLVPVQRFVRTVQLLYRCQ